jgi:hypothetical protein
MNPSPRWFCHTLYLYHPFQTHDLSAFEVRVEIPFDPTVPFRGAIISNDVDDAVEKMAHVALTTFCERSLTMTADTSLALFPIHNQEEPVCQ